HVIVLVRRRGTSGAVEGDAYSAPEAITEQLVGAILDPARDVGIGRTAVGGVVLEAAIVGRIVRRSHDYAVSQSAGTPAIVAEDRVRDNRSRGVTVSVVDHHVHFISSENFEGGRERG